MAWLPASGYVGRTDDQVKLRGLRIELGEIQNGRLTARRRGCCRDRRRWRGGYRARGLCRAPPGRHARPDVLRELAGQTLAAHMIPASFTVLDALPMTAVGKLDVRATRTEGELDYTAPASAPRPPSPLSSPRS